MKIKISISDTYMVADMPEKKAREIFWKMSELMKIMARPESKKEAEKKETSPVGDEADEDMEVLACLLYTSHRESLRMLAKNSCPYGVRSETIIVSPPS